MSPGGKENQFLPETERSSWLYQLQVICMLKGSSLVSKEIESRLATCAANIKNSPSL